MNKKALTFDQIQVMLRKGHAGSAGTSNDAANRLYEKHLMVITIRMSPEQKRLIDESPPLKILSAEEADQYLPPLPKTNRACCRSSAD